MPEKPTPPETKIVHEPGLFETSKSYWDAEIDIPWSIVILATIFFIVSLFNV